MSKYIDGLTTLVVFIVSILFVWNEASALVMADRAGLSFLFGLVSLVIVSQVYKDAKGSTSRTVSVPSTVADPVVVSEQTSLDIEPSESVEVIDDSALQELFTLEQVPAAIETACIVEFPQVKATKKQPTSRAKTASKSTSTRSKTAAKSKSSAAKTMVKEPTESVKKKTSKTKADSISKSTATKTTSAKRRSKKTVEGEDTISES